MPITGSTSGGSNLNYPSIDYNVLADNLSTTKDGFYYLLNTPNSNSQYGDLIIQVINGSVQQQAQHIRRNNYYGTNAYQTILFDNISGSDSTGLANDTTEYDIVLTTQDGTPDRIILGQDAQTFDDLINALNSAYTDIAIFSIVDGNILCQIALQGSGGSVEITNNEIFSFCNDYIGLQDPTPFVGRKDTYTVLNYNFTNDLSTCSFEYGEYGVTKFISNLNADADSWYQSIPNKGTQDTCTFEGWINSFDNNSPDISIYACKSSLYGSFSVYNSPGVVLERCSVETGSIQVSEINTPGRTWINVSFRGTSGYDSLYLPNYELRNINVDLATGFSNYPINLTSVDNGNGTCKIDFNESNDKHWGGYVTSSDRDQKLSTVYSIQLAPKFGRLYETRIHATEVDDATLRITNQALKQMQDLSGSEDIMVTGINYFTWEVINGVMYITGVVTYDY